MNRRRQKGDMSQVWSEYKADPTEERRNQLIEHYLPLVRSTAERLKSKLPESLDVNDLFSSGILGLMDAVEKFEPERGIRFETYCSLRVRGAILDDLRAADWVPRLVRSKAQQLERVSAELQADLNRPPSDEEISERLGISLDQFHAMRKEVEVRVQVSLENRWNESADDGDARRDLQPLEMIEDKRQRDPHDSLERKEIRELAIKGLSEKERAVVVMYYFDCLTMKEIGAVLSLSESRVCQIHAQTMALLRDKFTMLGEQGYHVA